MLVTIVTSIFCSVGAYCDENDLRDVAFMKPNKTPEFTVLEFQETLSDEH